MWRALPTLAAAFVVLAAAGAVAAPTFPTLSGRVVDEADIIPPDVEASLTAKLAQLERQTGDQFVVATVTSLQGDDIRTYGTELGRHWGLGAAGKANGVILLVAPNEREVGFEVGNGLKGKLTDALTRTIIENAMVPRFRANDMADGIQRGVDDTLQVLTGDAQAIEELAAKRPADNGLWNGLIPILFILIAFLVFRSMKASPGSTVPGGGGAFGGGSSGTW